MSHYGVPDRPSSCGILNRFYAAAEGRGRREIDRRRLKLLISIAFRVLEVVFGVTTERRLVHHSSASRTWSFETDLMSENLWLGLENGPGFPDNCGAGSSYPNLQTEQLDDPL